MSDVLSQAIPLALAAAISPVLLLLQVNMLTGGRPIARGAALTAGAAVVLIVGSTLGVFVGETGFSTNVTLKAWVDVVFGALLVLVGVRALLRPRPPRSPEREVGSLGRSFLTGAVGMASNVTTFALYIPALALIAGSGLPLGQKSIASLVILVITLMVTWVPLLVAATVPGASSRVLPAVGLWMRTNDRWIQVGLGFGFGIWLLLKGVDAM
jgi:threonine/homoserine/homoserine lactone efflux protein